MALIRKVDCVRLYVPDLEVGLSFYREQLGHELIWRCVVVEDRWSNPFILLKADANGNVISNLAA